MQGSGLRGEGVTQPITQVGVPTRVFLFTLDQLSVMLDVSQSALEAQYLYFEGRSIGARHRYLMIARNIAPPNHKPEWRVAERELIRWLRFKGFRYYEHGVISN